MDLVGTIFSLLIFLGIDSILILSLNLEQGYTGITNFGLVMFYAIGAFAAGAIAANILIIGFPASPWSPEAVMHRLSLSRSEPLLPVLVFLLSIIVAIGVGATVGYFAAYAPLRSVGWVAGFILLSFGEILRIVARNYYPIAGGPYGLAGIPNPFLGVNNPQIMMVAYGITVWTIALLVYFYSQRISNSPYGRVLRSIRDDQLASKSFGKRVLANQLKIMAVGSAFSALAGALYVFYAGYVHPDDFMTAITFNAYAALILGGIGNHKGAMLGAGIMAFVDKATRIIKQELGLGFGIIPFDIVYLRYIAVAVLLLIIVLYRPQGVLPEQPLRTPASKVIGEDDNDASTFERSEEIRRTSGS